VVEHVTIVLPCDLRYRDAAAALIREVCERLEREGEERGLGHQVVSAFNEAFNNLSLHGPGAGRARSPVVEVELVLGAGELAIELRDQGDPFDYDDVTPPDLDQLPESGLGIFIMRSFMSEVCYTPRDGESTKNVLRMVRALARPS
jgi:serine/threonine-protein kinase RsbW